MTEEKKSLSLKDRLKEKKKIDDGIPSTTLNQEDFAKKQEELKRQEELRKLEEIKKQKMEEEKKRQEELRRLQEEALKKLEEERKRKAEEEALKKQEYDAYLKAVSGETAAPGGPTKAKHTYIILAASVLVTFIVAYSLSSIFSGRKILNESITQANMALEILEKSEPIFDKYEQYLEKHKGEKIDFGAGDILGKEGVELLKGNEFTEKFQIYAASLYKSAGKDMIKYSNLLMSLIENSNRLNSILVDKKTVEILQGVNEQKELIKLNAESIVTVVNTDYPLPENKEIVIKMGEMVQFLDVYDDPEVKKKGHKPSPLDEKLKVRLLRDSNVDFIIPKVYLVPVLDAYKLFETIKPEFVKYETAYKPIKEDWKELNSVRKRLKEALKKKSEEPKYFTF